MLKAICMECGKKFDTRATEPRCPKCGGYDIEPRLEDMYSAALIAKIRMEGLR